MHERRAVLPSRLPEADGYTPIADYGVIGNLRTVALVSRAGSIDWCCFPELDRPSVFGALLDRERGGRFRVWADGAGRAEQRYEGGQNVLVTSFITDAGRLAITDFMPLRGPIAGTGARGAPEIHRVLHCESGEVDVNVEWAPRFDYARAEVQIRRVPGGALAMAGAESMELDGLPTGNEPPQPSPGSMEAALAVPDAAADCRIVDEGGAPTLRASFHLSGGERVALVTRYTGGRGADRDTEDGTAPAPAAADARHDVAESLRLLTDTGEAWRGWVHHCERPEECVFTGPWHDQLVRSGLVLKLLTHPHTGAIAAAATTSLPEEIGGVRNWDYRYGWIRDSAFAAQALYALGHRAEALGFLEWAQRAAAQGGTRPTRLQIMYGLHGETGLAETILPHLEGYRASRPVRVGNAAAAQRQLDVYGELLSAAYELLRLGGTIAPELWRFLSSVADEACEAWRHPDSGIWEIRAEPRHFVYSKVMAWVALDRALRLADRFGLQGKVTQWRRERDAIREAVLTHGYDAAEGAFVQAFGTTALDASNLLIPLVDFLPADDPRVQGTIDRTLERLTVNGLVYRYLNDDGLPGGEGAFGLPTFWLVDALALSGRLDEARALFEGAAARANHLGLFAEEFDPSTGEQLGNFPQAFTHIGFINSALYLARAEGRHASVPAPTGTAAHGAEGSTPASDASASRASAPSASG